MMTRWLAYIRLFDFHVKHIAGNKNGAADALSRRGGESQDLHEDEDEADDYFDAKLYSIQASYRSDQRHSPTAWIYLHEADYEGDDLTLGRYLETLQRPNGMSDQQFEQLRKKSRSFLVRDGHLYKRSKKRHPPRRVIGKAEQRRKVLCDVHEFGHRGQQGTYDQLRRRYQWKGMYDDVVKYVKSCEECQSRSWIRQEEPLHPTWSLTVWEKIGIDVVYMPWTEDGFGFIVFARDDLSGWVEGRAIKAADSKNVARFIYEEVICRHGCPQRIVLDGGNENLNLTKELLKHYRIKRTVVSAYHPQANGLVERGRDFIVNSLAKYYCKKLTDWIKYLPLAL